MLHNSKPIVMRGLKFPSSSLPESNYLLIESRFFFCFQRVSVILVGAKYAICRTSLLVKTRKEESANRYFVSRPLLLVVSIEGQ